MSADAVANELIPVRALNQANYCPRLYYLEYVEGLMPVNEFVADGTFQHRRVTDPELENRARKDGDAVQTRSVALSSERLGLTGKLDIVEEKDGQAYPVEYKRSAAPHVPSGFWENDAIQVCAQGMLLEEELGREVRAGVLYYAGSKTRVPVPLDEALREKTLQTVRLIRELGAKDAPPAPLGPELRNRCYGCSLAPVCQPEETLYLIGQRPLTPEEEPAAGLTRVLPHSDDGAVLYLQEQGAHVGKKSEHLVVKKDGAELNRVPIAAVRQVVIFGNVQISTQALETLATSQIPVVFLSMYGRFIASLQPAPTKNVLLRIDQHRIFADPARAFELSKAVVRAKIANQRTLLMRSLRSREEAPAEAAGSAEEPAARAPSAGEEPAVRAMAELLERLERIDDPAVLLGTEGQAAALYFGQFGRMLKAATPGRDFDFQTRNRRPPRDPVNALLSFAYALLAKDCFSALCTVGFDPYCGFFHAGRYGKPALALDLMEEFRAVIADSVVLTLINNRMLTTKEFLVWREACHLTDEGRKRFFQAYEQRKATVITHPVFGYKMSYSRMLEVQARMLAAYLRGDIPAYTGFTIR